MPSIADTAARVAAAGVPVLFLDTCNILDVIRAPVRNLTGCVEAATELVAGVTAVVPRLALVVGSFVPTEWADNAPGVPATLTRHLSRMDEQAGHFHDLCGHLGIGLSFGRSRYSATALADRLHDLSRELLDAAVVLDRHPDTSGRAFDRVTVTRRRPCRNGSELKDCTIFEESLEVCRRVAGASPAPRMVFCSSNTSDYCDGNVVPHPDIAADCAAVGLVFTTTLPWAVAELKT